MGRPRGGMPVQLPSHRADMTKEAGRRVKRNSTGLERPLTPTARGGRVGLGPEAGMSQEEKIRNFFLLRKRM